METQKGNAEEIGYNDTNRGVKRKRREARGTKRFSPLLQMVFELCKEVFKGQETVPLPDDVARMCRLLDYMRAEDVGLNGDMHLFKCDDGYEETEETTRVITSQIYKCDHFSLCIFILPSKARIPLHNHPEMTVFSKLLLGKMHVKSYDFVDPLDDAVSIGAPSKVTLAKTVTNAEISAPFKASVLYPNTGGNIHEFTAITPCLILDVIGPPYSKEEGRDCSYYADVPYATLSCKIPEDGCCYRWLEEIDEPEDSEMVIIPYLGPKIVLTVTTV